MKLIDSLKRVGIKGCIALSLLSPVFAEEKPRVIDGWVESTAGVKQGPNLRLYPRVNINGIKLKSLTDLNGFYSFTKTDLSHEKLEKKLGENLTLKPVFTLHANASEKYATGDVNLNASYKNYSGFFEVDVNPLDIKKSKFCTYHNLSTKIGNFGFFATGKLRDIKSTYTEVEFTGKSIKNSGISPYTRINLVKGDKPTYQEGVSINPRNLVRFFHGRKRK